MLEPPVSLHPEYEQQLCVNGFRSYFRQNFKRISKNNELYHINVIDTDAFNANYA